MSDCVVLVIFEHHIEKYQIHVKMICPVVCMISAEHCW